MVFPRFETIFSFMVITTSALHLPNSYPENITPDSEVEPKTMTIGMNNVFEVGCGILFDSLDYTYSTSLIIFYTYHGFLVSIIEFTLADNSQYLKPWK